MTQQISFGRYTLEHLLGEGGMGQVWAAFDNQTRRRVAVKVMPAELARDDAYRTRFLREAEATASLQEPHVVPIHGFGEIAGQLYIDMALIVGDDVGTMLRESGPMTLTDTISIIEQTAAALDAAHAIGLVHRDVKPSNIVIHGTGFVYLIDFGIAWRQDQPTLTERGGAVGTWAYMAPERFEGELSTQVDIYSLACVLYECLTGSMPFVHADPAQQMVAHLFHEPPRAGAVNPEVPSVLDDVIARGMAKLPCDRYESAGALAAAARAAVQMPRRLAVTEVAPPRLISTPPGPAPAHRPRRSMRRAIVGAVLVVLLAGAATVIGVAALNSEKPSGTAASAGPTTPPEPPGSILATIATGAGANSVAIDPAGFAYVSNGTDGSVAVLDTNKQVLLTTTDVEAGPIGLAVDTAAHSVYVANARSGTLSVIDTGSRTVRATVELDVIALTAVLDPAAKTAYSTTHGNGDKIFAVDTTSNTVRASTTIDCGRGFPFGLAVDAELQIALVACANDIVTIDIRTMSVTDRIPTGPRPHGIVIDTHRHIAYVANRETGSVHVIDIRSRTLTATVKVGRDAAHLALDNASNTAYVANREDHTVSMIDTTSNTVVATIDVGGKPQGIAVDPRTQDVYVTDSERGTVIVLAGRR
ncbi:serine/threonine-protein kinase [Nocardia sp. PE-7]|uniref:serine/threonine-protein kinase n=1 Tax=Nocardia sp. PE-7 TaxID=3058426 RepID=UPI002659DBF8|nr:serine/threonine-protein kinase [Nocardia sp. PE-7]WKG12426.1 serine/threonine-protein kinase [Nocardia sp. PE-7]